MNKLFNLVFLLLVLINGLSSDEIYYNTTSGEYEARVIEILSSDNNTAYLHRLEIPYAEKPERFKQALMKKFVSGKHSYSKPVVCYQSVQMTSYGLFTIQGRAVY